MQLLQDFFAGSEIFQYTIVPLFIFCARVLDVSVSTVRMMFVWAGNRYFATLLGFFEALIWIVAIGQIMKDISNWASYFAYAAGYASGTFTGMFIENKLAYGKSIIRVITRTPASELLSFLKAENFGITSFEAEGNKGKVYVFYTVLHRKKVNYVISKIKDYNPKAFYTIENVKYVNDNALYEADTFRSSFLTKFSRLPGLQQTVSTKEQFLD